ncbi:TPR-like protein [Teratosphaeria nubilosa]|uniref:TPR-like protein n=1 Tax=Teratosphaeria nubilosa TaxID=161662 RepID=A0A6G1L2N8_9PEZI|nr:TPR-like protein [Teratosphaeria nubilosa]
MSVKANLKAAKAALDAEDYAKTIEEAQAALSSDPQNYFARLFLGRALEKQEKYEDAAKAYRSAAESKPDDTQGWLGLCSVYEVQGGSKIDEYREAAVRVAQLYANADDKHRCQSIVDKLTSLAKKKGTPQQYRRTLEVLLPGGPIYDYLEGRIQHPSLTYTRLAEIIEQEEAQRIKQQIAERRTRIGAKIGQVTTDVKREAFESSQLEQIYQHVIDWASEDEVRRQYEEKLLQRAFDLLVVLPTDAKAAKLNQVLDLAQGMVIIHHPFRLAWEITLETRDLDDLKDLDVNSLREYISFFPESGLSKVLKAWLSSELSPFPTPPKDEENTEVEQAKEIGSEDRLLLITEGLAAAEQSPSAHRLVADYYLHLEEYESAVHTARNGLKAASIESQKLGMTMQNTRDAMNSTLGTALVHFQGPRNHVEARRLFEDILQRKARSTPALIGLGLIYEETEDYQKAVDFLVRALNEDKGNLRVGTELAWCRALSGNYAQAQQELEAALPKLKTDDPRARDLRAQVLYRIGVCVWETDTSKSARRSRDGAYARFLAAIKTNVNFAPAYTYLGYYYGDYAKDRKRARQCFQKAFELSPAEVVAAERLAKSFADQGDWDIVEVISQRVVDSGRARPPPGSKRKGISWPYSALGVVQMNRQDYQRAITSLLSALRINPDDYQSYVGLGESYHNSGRYNSALRTFNHALEPLDDMSTKKTGETWVARYMLANVHRELGEYDEAIEGLEDVLKERPDEFGVLTSLLQTFVEKAWRCLDTGMFGQSITSAIRAIDTAKLIAKSRPQAFNVWKAVGDACLVFTWIQSGMVQFPKDNMLSLLNNSTDHQTYIELAEIDQVCFDSLSSTQTNGTTNSTALPLPLTAGILAYKRAISACSHDSHAQAVAWYNLGWVEHRSFVCSEPKPGKKYLKAAVRAFKRAIELEAGNAEFWNALGVVTTTLNPQIAQHAFVRSLHLNELNAKVWVNLGVLYLLENDHELSHQAFSRAQSTDPTYAHAWVGEGLIALLLGDAKEALNHFTHAFEVSESSSTISKRQYAVSSFDHLLAWPSASNDLTKLIQPIFALEQLHAQLPAGLPYRHLAALFLERVSSLAAAIEALDELCASAEADYETSESLAALARFALAKSDLARCQLASSAFQPAAENAETALDLSLDAESSGLDSEARQKLRLSAHLTAGLAYHNLQQGSEAISMFRTALEESNSNPDVVCLLVKVLWAHGGADEKTAAREQLFEVVEKYPEHVASVTLLGAIAALDDDNDTANAVKDDLLTLRTKNDLHPNDLNDIESLLSALAHLQNPDAPVEAFTEAQSATLLRPDQSIAWTELAGLSGESYAAAMALKTAQKAVPPAGEMEAGTLAKAFAGAGLVGDAQRAIVHAPWESAGWEALGEALG